MRTCKIEGCTKEVRARDVCAGHYNKLFPCKRKCSVEGCSSRVKALDLCNKHYFRKIRYGDVTFVQQERHGMMDIPEYRVWASMIQRCSDKTGKHAHRYVNRGIKVCNEWRTSFTKFLSDMGRRPEGKMDIDRIDNDGNYTPENCRWCTREENAQNASFSKLNADAVRFIRKSKLHPKELKEKFGVSSHAIYAARKGITWKNVK